MRYPSYMDIFCLANYPADEVLQDVQSVLKICIQSFTSYNTKMISYLRSVCYKIIITIRVNKEIKKFRDEMLEKSNEASLTKSIPPYLK